MASATVSVTTSAINSGGAGSGVISGNGSLIAVVSKAGSIVFSTGCRVGGAGSTGTSAVTTVSEVTGSIAVGSGNCSGSSEGVEYTASSGSIAGGDSAAGVAVTSVITRGPVVTGAIAVVSGTCSGSSVGAECVTNSGSGADGDSTTGWAKSIADTVVSVGAVTVGFASITSVGIGSITGVPVVNSVAIGCMKVTDSG